MAITAGIVTTDATEYCRYYPGMDVMTVRIDVTGGSIVSGEQYIVSILRAAQTNWPEQYRPVMTKTIVASGSGATFLMASFQIGIDDVDPDGIARAISGSYNVRVSNASNTVSWDMGTSIRIALVPVVEMRTDWCFGAPLRSIEGLSPKFQPKNVTGVVIDEISSDTIAGPKALALTYVSPNAWTLSWDNGLPVIITPLLKKQYLLMDEMDSSYILATVTATTLPQANVSERILVVQGEMTEGSIARKIRNAANLAESTMGFPLEPTLYTTMPIYPGMIREHNHQTDHWDRVARPSDYIVPTNGYAWPSFRMAYQWCIKIHKLYGFHSVDKIIEVEGDWWNNTTDRMSGFVTLIPALASFARWTVFTHPMLAPFYMHRDIQGFWQYDATFGLPDLKDSDRMIMREFIARHAAISVLLEAQRGYQGGLGSQSTGRDGLSNSFSYNAGGPYASTLAEHRQWLITESPRIKQKLGGLLFSTIGSS